MTETALAGWHRVVASRSPDGLADLLADDAAFNSPAVHATQHGKPVVVAYLRAALRVLNAGTFRYTNEWIEERSAVLEFECDVDGKLVNGVDIIHWNAEEKIVLFKVMIRPLRALTAVVAAMQRELGSEPASTELSSRP